MIEAQPSRPGGRLEPEQWDDDVTNPRHDVFELAALRLRARFDRELGCELDRVDQEGWVS